MKIILEKCTLNWISTFLLHTCNQCKQRHFTWIDQAWISRSKLKSKLRLKSEILLKFEKSQKNAFLEKKN